MTALIAAYVFFVVFTVTICTFALWRGGRSERAAALILIMGVLGTQIAERISGTKWHGPEYGVFLVDTLVFVALMVVVHQSNRFWPLWAAASQLVATFTHVVVILQPNLPMEAYLAIQPFWVFPLLMAIGIGTWTQQKARG